MRNSLIPLLCLALFSSHALAADLPFVNWENHPIHAVDLSPDRSLLAVTHTADQRVQLFDVSSGEPVSLGHVVVGIDPVSVRFRNQSELWVVNHISDSVSVVDVAARRVIATLPTADEPFDVVFAGTRAFVSCSQANQVWVFDATNRALAPQVVPIAAEDPRALAVSADGRFVYAAIFESGNATTLLSGGRIDNNLALPNVVSDPRGPYAGVNPPPNVGDSFVPAVHPQARPPAVGLIVRKGADARWRDDNQRDWTAFVSGPMAAASGRVPGWDLPDRDLAIIDSSTLAVRYVSGLMNIGMALAVNPGSGEVGMVGTDALNELRFEPRVNSQFVRVKLARVNPQTSSVRVSDLNTHLNYQQITIPPAQRQLSVGDPRALVWNAAGSRGWVVGLGSNNVVVIDAQGARVGNPIAVGEGPIGLALDEPRKRLYVWNHFAASLSVLNSDTSVELLRIPVFNPLPASIRAGRPLLYDTHRTSGLGQASCGSCHVDARMDRLAWDLGDPSHPPERFEQNCTTTLTGVPCADYHAMKGPMTTQTMQDIIGHEPFHWRGDRAGIEAFNPAFRGLLGDDEELTAADMQKFENFLATVTFPPNPFRNFDNTLPTALRLEGHYTSGRFAMAGLELGVGDAARGLQRYSHGTLDNVFECASCHTLPTGMAVNGPLFVSRINFAVGGRVMARGPMGENHLGIVSNDGSTNVSIKVPQLRNQYEKVGMNLGRVDSAAGFGFLHDGSVDSLSRFLSAGAFSVRSDQDVADLVAFSLAFSGSDFAPGDNPVLGAAPPLSRDTPAAVGAQVTLRTPAAVPRVAEMLNLARSRRVDLVVHAARASYSFDAASERFSSADGTTALSPEALQQRASDADPHTWSVVPAGLGKRLGVDRDGDGVANLLEVAQGSNPADAASSVLRPAAGMWFNPQRSGHGIDLQFLGSNMFVTWFTYLDDGSPVWYQAAAPYANPWVGKLQRFTWNPARGSVDAAEVGELRMSFTSALATSFSWRLGARSGVEAMQPLIGGNAASVPDRTGNWYNTQEPGWGMTIYTVGAMRVAVGYFYDAANQPRWVIGQGDNAAVASVPMNSLRGFCPDCALSTPVPADGGSLSLNFASARRGSATTDFKFGTGASWLRTAVTITPLSEPALHPERF